MSDILLSVGLQKGAAETSQLQADLQSIISRLDKNPPKVKVGLTVDHSALNHFKSQLTQIVNSVGLSKGAPITVNISGLGEITAEAGKAKKALDGVSSAGKAAAEAVNNMSGKKAADSLTQINNQIILMQANLAKWTAAQNGNASASYAAYSQQLTVLMELKTLVEQNAISAEDFAERLSKIKAAASDAAAAIKGMGEDHAAKSVEKLTKDSEAYNTALGKTETLLAQVKKRQIDWTAAKNGKSSAAYTALTSYQRELENLISKLMAGEMTADEFAAAFANNSAKVKTAEGTIRSCGENTKTLGDRLKGLADKFGAWLSVSQVIMQAVRAIKQMVTAVREIDAAMTELKKVTDETNATYDKFLANAGARAKKVGASISDVVTATADFARLGYDIDKASVLADTAIIYKNIGDGIEDITTASESIISTMQAFGIEASNAMSIVDKFNEVGNNFAISSAGIGEAMQRSAAAMASANNTIDETIALITAANTIVQDPDSVGTTMKTVSMYLRAAKTEAEEAGESTEGMANSVSELRDAILDLTGQKVDIQIDENTFKSTYQILQELSQVWDSLTDISQANLLEMIGGKRNANVVSALLENFSVAEKALKSSMDSAGSALAENEKHLESINGKIEIFKATFQELAMNFISSDFVKGIVDFGTGLLEVLNAVAKLMDALGGLNTVLYVTLSLLAMSKYQAILSFLSKLGSSVIKIVGNIGTLNTTFAQLKSKGVGSLNALSQALNTVGISASKVQIILAAVVAVIGIAVSAYNKWKQAQEEARQEAISQAEAAAELSGEISDLTIQYITLSEAVQTDASAKESLIQTQDELIEKLGLEQYEIDKLIEKYGSLSDAILQASKQELQTAEIDLKAGVKAREDELMDAISWVQRDNREYDNAYIDLRGIGYYSGGSLFPTDADYAKMEKANADALVAFEALQKAGLLGAGSKQNGMGDFVLEFGFDIDSVEGMIATHEKLRQMLFVVDDAAGSNNQVYEHLYGLYKNIDGAVANYTNNVSALNSNLAQQYVIQGLIGKEVSNTKEEFDTYRQSVIDAAIASGHFIGSAEEIERAIDSVLKSDASFSHFYADVAENAQTSTEHTTVSIKSLETALERMNEVINGGQSSISTLSDALSKLRNGALTLSDVIDLLQDSPGLAPYVDLEAEGYGNLHEGLTEMIKESYRQTEIELRALKLSGDLSKEDAEAVDSMRDAIERLANEALSDVIPQLDGFAKSLSKIEGVSSGLDMLGEVYWDVKDGKTFDWSSILNNEAFTEAFGGLGDAYNNFIRTIANSPNDIDACQTAFDKLASAYIRNSDALEGVTEETKAVAVAILDQMGVANAAAVVEAQLAYNKERAVYATEAYANASYEQVLSLLQEAESGSIAKQVLAELAVQKWVINAESIETSSDINELISLAETANATSASMERLLKVKELLSEAEYHKSEADSIGNRTDIDYKFHINQYSQYLRNAQELLNAPLEYEKFNFSQFDISYTGGLKSKSNSSKEETWFEKQYKYHKHLVEMDKESISDYLNWLNGAYKKAYDEGIIELDEYYSFQEEVYQGTQDLFKDHLNDIDHEISLLEGTVGSSDEVIALAAQAMADIEKELEAARAAGLDENSDYIQYLKQQWANYSKTVIDLREQAETESKSSIDRLVDYRIDMLKQEIENEKDALDEKLDNLREFYDKQRKMLQDQYDEEKYLEEQKEKRKSVSDIEAELAMLEYDDSAWAQKRKAELQEQLADAKKGLSDFEKDHALDMTLDMLDEQQAAQEAQIQAEMDALDAKLNDPQALFNRALEDIKNNTKQLYQEFIEYNRKYGTGNDQDIANMWEEAYKADLEYQDTHNGGHLDGIEIGNYTGYKNPETQAPPDAPKDNTPADDQSNGSSYGNVSDVSGTLKYGSKGDGVRALQYALNSLGYGNSGTKSLDGSFGRRTENAVKAFQKATGLTQDGRVGRKTKAKFKEKGYASGTENATPGIHAIEEFGPEYIFTSPSDGTRYRMFTGGEKVLNAEATNFLYDFATTGGSVLTKMLADLLSLSGFGSIAKPVQAIEVNSGDIIIQGNADMKTVSEIRRAQRENLEFIIKEFNKLNK